MKNSTQKGNVAIVLLIIVVLVVGGWYFSQKINSDQQIGDTSESSIQNQQAEDNIKIANIDEKTEVNVAGPTILKDGEMGTWVVEVSVDDSSSLSYGVIWGDESEYKNVMGGMPLSAIVYQKSPNFSHTYFKVAPTGTTWTPVFFVKDSQGNVVRKGVSVNVGM